MRRLILTILLIVFLTGCNSREATIDDNSQTTLFSITENYKKGRAGFYIIDSYNNRLDTKDVELGLMEVSAFYFNVNNTYYQNGQYLSRDNLKKIIQEINQTPITLNNKEYKLPIVNYIFETNYLNAIGDLKGISLAIALNSEFMLDNELIKPTKTELRDCFLKSNGSIIELIRKNKELEEQRIVIGLYKLNKNTDLLPGTYIARGVTKDDQIKNLTNIEKEHVMMNTEAFKNIDEVNYKAYYTLENELRSKYKSILINGFATYNNKILENMDITVNVGAVSISNVMAVGQDLITKINQLFSDKKVKIIIKNDNRDAAFLIWNDANKNGNIYLLP